MPTENNTPNATGATQPVTHLPFKRIAFRGVSEDTAETYIGSDPNLGYPMGYFGRIAGIETRDQVALRREYYAIISEVSARG